MNQSDNQSIVINGVSEVAHDGTLDDLSVHNADAIKGGPSGEITQLGSKRLTLQGDGHYGN
jgi:hypothetical protein